MFIDLSKIKSGFSDKLRAITFYIALSKFKKINEFQVYEKKNYQCPFKFTDFCKIKKINIKKKNRNKFNKKNFIFNSYNSEINLKNCTRANLYADVVDNKRLLKYWLLSFKKIYPNKYLTKKIKKINLPKKYLSIHIRSTDRVIKLKNFLKEIQLRDMIFDTHINAFPEQITKFINKYSDCKNIYISSDQEFLKSEIIRKLKEQNYKVFYNNCNFQNLNYRKTNGEDFLIDLFCMSKSKIILSTVGGGVPYTAKLISGERTKVINWSNQLNIFVFYRILILIVFYLKKIKLLVF